MSVTYDWIDSYRDFYNLFSVEEAVDHLLANLNPTLYSKEDYGQLEKLKYVLTRTKFKEAEQRL